MFVCYWVIDCERRKYIVGRFLSTNRIYWPCCIKQGSQLKPLNWWERSTSFFFLYKKNDKFELGLAVAAHLILAKWENVYGSVEKMDCCADIECSVVHVQWCHTSTISLNCRRYIPSEREKSYVFSRALLLLYRCCERTSWQASLVSLTVSQPCPSIDVVTPTRMPWCLGTFQFLASDASSTSRVKRTSLQWHSSTQKVEGHLEATTDVGEGHKTWSVCGEQFFAFTEVTYATFRNFENIGIRQTFSTKAAAKFVQNAHILTF